MLSSASTTGQIRVVTDADIFWLASISDHTYSFTSIRKHVFGLFTGYAQNGIGEEALWLLRQMLKFGVRPDPSTLVSVLTPCSSLASLKEGRQTHVLLVKNGSESNVFVCSALITMYSKCGGILDSELAFRQIDSPDLVSWYAIITAFTQHGLVEKALDFCNQMELKGFKPNGITFRSLISACGHAGKVNESINFFDSMVKHHGIAPRSEHCGCLVDILSRAGQLKEAFKIIEEMPFEADSRIWGALLAACGVYLNAELGELAAKKIVELDPQNSRAYVILSNIYAATGMWREVTRVRGLMKEKGIKKQRSCSWLEIGNDVNSEKKI